jgi:ADP-heptose:LPS heptosyltransferase
VSRDQARILVIARGHIADLIQALPALRAIRQRYPEGHVVAVVNEYTRGLLEGCPYVDEVVYGFAYEERGRVRRLLDLTWLVGRLALRFDVAFCLRFAPEMAPVLALASGARVRVGFDQPGLSGRLLTHNAGPQPADTPNRILNLMPLHTLGIEGAPDYEPMTWWGDEVRRTTAALLGTVGVDRDRDGYAVFHVSSNWGCNELAAEKWARICELVREKHGLVPVIVGVDDPFEVAKYRAIAELASVAPVSLQGRTSLPQLCEVVRTASLVVATDSVLTHVALAQQVPAVIMFGIEPIVYNAPLADELERMEVIQHWEGPGLAPTPNPHCRFVGGYCHSEHCRENSSLAQTTVDEIAERIAATLRRREAAGIERLSS